MAKAATYKIYTGSAWEELTFTPSSHTHSEYLSTSGGTINGVSTINTTSNTNMTIPALNILHTGPKDGSSYADLMILSGFNQAPYGFRFRTYGDGTAIIQSQRINNNGEVFPLSLNPNGGDVLMNGKLIATQEWVNSGYLSTSGGTLINDGYYTQIGTGYIEVGYKEENGTKNPSVILSTDDGLILSTDVVYNSQDCGLVYWNNNNGKGFGFTSVYDGEPIIVTKNNRIHIGNRDYFDRVDYSYTFPSESGTIALADGFDNGTMCATDFTASNSLTVGPNDDVGINEYGLSIIGDLCRLEVHDRYPSFHMEDDYGSWTNINPGSISLYFEGDTYFYISPEEQLVGMYKNGNRMFEFGSYSISLRDTDVITYDEDNNRVNGNFYTLNTYGVKATYVDTDQIYLKGYLSTSELYVGDSDEICMDSSGISANEVRAISIYENGTALSNKYQAKGSYLTYHLYRPIKINGTEILSNISSTALNLKAGSNVSITNSGGVVTISASGGGGSSGTVTDYSGIIRETQIYDGSLSAGAYKDVTLFQSEEIPLNEGDVVRLYVYASASYKRQQVGVIEVQMVDDGDGGLIGRGNMFTVRSNYSYQSLLVEAIVDYSGYTDIFFNIHALTASASAARSTLAVYKVEVISNS